MLNSSKDSASLILIKLVGEVKKRCEYVRELDVEWATINTAAVT